MLISEAFALYKQDVIIFRNQSRKTEENHDIVARAIVKHCGDIEIESLTFESVRRWKLELDKGRSAETVRNYIIKLRVVLAYLRKCGYKVLDPDLVAVPKRTDKVPAFISKEEVAQLLKCTNKIKNKCIVSFLYASGIRISELCSLNRSSIKDNSFTVVGKGGKARLCFIDERTQVLLDLYLDSRTDNNQALFLSESGKRITPGAIQETFKTIRKRSGIDCHPHTLRHSFATDLLRNNANMRYVQTLLGHSSLQTTQMYLHVTDHDLQEVYKGHHTY